VPCANGTAQKRRRDVAAGSGLVLIGVFSQQLGAAAATQLFDDLGPGGVVFVRLALAAAFLLAVCRPRLRSLSRDDWWLVVAFGCTIATMNLCFYHAIQRIPMGAAATLEILGPLGLSVLVSRSKSGVVWAILALAGVGLLGRGGGSPLDALGVFLALAAGVGWATYVVLAAHVGARIRRVDGLALGMCGAALVAAPVGVLEARGSLLDTRLLLPSILVAVLASILPYTVELLALRRLPAASFAVLLSFAPVAAAVAGAIVLDQGLGLFEAAAIALVTLASMGAVLSGGSRDVSKTSGRFDPESP